MKVGHVVAAAGGRNGLTGFDVHFGHANQFGGLEAGEYAGVVAANAPRADDGNLQRVHAALRFVRCCESGDL